MRSKISDKEIADGPSTAVWCIELKLKALAYLFNGFDGSDVGTQRAYLGIEVILEEILDRLAWVRECIDRDLQKRVYSAAQLDEKS